MVSPGPRPRPELKPNRTRGLVRRATPFLAIGAIVAIQFGADLNPLFVFPLYVAVVLVVALYRGRVDSFAVAGLAAIGILIPSIATGDPSADAAGALLLATVLVVVVAVVHEVVARIRRDAAAVERKAIEVEASEERLRITVETAPVGIEVSGCAVS